MSEGKETGGGVEGQKNNVLAFSSDVRTRQAEEMAQKVRALEKQQRIADRYRSQREYSLRTAKEAATARENLRRALDEHKEEILRDIRDRLVPPNNSPTERLYIRTQLATIEGRRSPKSGILEDIVQNLERFLHPNHFADVITDWLKPLQHNFSGGIVSVKFRFAIPEKPEKGGDMWLTWSTIRKSTK